MPQIPTKELEALKLKAEETEATKAKVTAFQALLNFLMQFKWLIMGGGIALILAKTGTLPSSFKELVEAVKSLIPALK